MENKISIIPFSPELANYFTNFNIKWVKKYFAIERLDEEMLSNPKHYIIDNGGFIFFAKYGSEIAGTFALLKVTDAIFELSKMAVDEKFIGKNIGNAIMEYCLQEGRRLGLEKIILYSNTLLGPAIHLYKKYGFKEVSNFVSEYKRANIYMEVNLK